MSFYLTLFTVCGVLYGSGSFFDRNPDPTGSLQNILKTICCLSFRHIFSKILQAFLKSARKLKQLIISIFYVLIIIYYYYFWTVTFKYRFVRRVSGSLVLVTPQSTYSTFSTYSTIHILKTSVIFKEREKIKLHLNFRRFLKVKYTNKNILDILKKGLQNNKYTVNVFTVEGTQLKFKKVLYCIARIII